MGRTAVAPASSETYFGLILNYIYCPPERKGPFNAIRYLVNFKDANPLEIPGPLFELPDVF